MMRAVEGLKIEQRGISISFAVLIVSFTISTILSFWVIMNGVAAMVSTLVFVIASRFWVVYSLRIIRRFHWTEGDAMEGIRSDGDGDGDGDAEYVSARTPSVQSMPGSASLGPNLSMEGFAAVCSYFLQEDTSPTSVFPSGNAGHKWMRRYITLTSDGSIFFYSDRKSFRANAAKNRLNERPLRMDCFSVVVREEDLQQVSTTISAPLTDSFIITLCPLESDSFKYWAFRFDNSEELQLWRVAFATLNQDL